MDGGETAPPGPLRAPASARAPPRSRGPRAPPLDNPYDSSETRDNAINERRSQAPGGGGRAGSAPRGGGRTGSAASRGANLTMGGRAGEGGSDRGLARDTGESVFAEFFIFRPKKKT